MAEVPSVEKKEETTASETVVNPDGTTTTTESKTTKESRAGFSEEKVESKSETVTPKGFWERHKVKRQAKSEARATATKGRSPILGWFGTSARKVRRVATDERSQVMLDERVMLENDIRDRRLKSQVEVLTHLEDLRQGIADNLTLFGHDHDRFGAMQHELDKLKQLLELHTEPSIEREALVARRMELEADIEAALTPKDRAEYSQLVKRQEAVDALYGEQLVKKAKEGVGSLSQAERSFMLHDLVNRGLDSAFSDITAKAKGFANMQDALRLLDINDVMATSEEVHGQAGMVTGKQYRRKWLDTLPGGVRKVLEMAGVGREGSSMNKVAQWDSFQDRLPRYWRERWTDLKRTGVGVGIAGAIALAAPISLPAVLVGAGGALAFRAVSDYVYRERKQHAENEAGAALNRLAFNELSETILKAREEALRYQRQVVGAPKEQLEEIQGHALNRIVDAMLKTQTTAVDEFKRIERVGKVVNAISGAVGGIAAGATWGAFQYHEKVAAAQELAKEGLWMKGANLVNLDLTQIDPSQISPERLAQLQTYQERFEQLRGMLGGVDQATTVVVNPDGAVSDGHAVEFVKNGWHRLVDTHGDRDLDQILSLLQEGKGGEFTTFVNQGDAAQMLTNYASDGTYHHVADHVGPLGHLLKHHWPEVYTALARDAVLGGGILGGLMGVGGSKVRSKRSDRLDPAEALALVDDRFPLKKTTIETSEAENLRATLEEWNDFYGFDSAEPTAEQLENRVAPSGNKIVGVRISNDGYIEHIIELPDGTRTPLRMVKDGANVTAPKITANLRPELKRATPKERLEDYLNADGSIKEGFVFSWRNILKFHNLAVPGSLAQQILDYDPAKQEVVFQLLTHLSRTDTNDTVRHEAGVLLKDLDTAGFVSPLVKLESEESSVSPEDSPEQDQGAVSPEELLRQRLASQLKERYGLEPVDLTRRTLPNGVEVLDVIERDGAIYVVGLDKNGIRREYLPSEVPQPPPEPTTEPTPEIPREQQRRDALIADLKTRYGLDGTSAQGVQVEGVGEVVEVAEKNGGVVVRLLNQDGQIIERTPTSLLLIKPAAETPPEKQISTEEQEREQLLKDAYRVTLQTWVEEFMQDRQGRLEDFWLLKEVYVAPEQRDRRPRIENMQLLRQLLGLERAAKKAGQTDGEYRSFLAADVEQINLGIDRAVDVLQQEIADTRSGKARVLYHAISGVLASAAAALQETGVRDLRELQVEMSARADTEEEASEPVSEPPREERKPVNPADVLEFLMAVVDGRTSWGQIREEVFAPLSVQDACEMRQIFEKQLVTSHPQNRFFESIQQGLIMLDEMYEGNIEYQFMNSYMSPDVRVGLPAPKEAESATPSNDTKSVVPQGEATGTPELASAESAESEQVPEVQRLMDALSEEIDTYSKYLVDDKGEFTVDSIAELREVLPERLADELITSQGKKTAEEHGRDVQVLLDSIKDPDSNWVVVALLQSVRDHLRSMSQASRFDSVQLAAGVRKRLFPS